MKHLSQAVDDYLQLRRGLGFKLRDTAHCLPDTQTNSGPWSWPWRRPVTRLVVPSASTTPLTRTTVWSPASSRPAGTRRS